jgi:hypothetical protein
LATMRRAKTPLLQRCAVASSDRAGIIDNNDL